MKSHILLSCMLLLGIYITGCENDTADVSRLVDVSFPTIQLKGDSVVILPVGAPYTEAGATGTDDITGQASDLQPASNNVDTSVPGIYLVEYAISNANGFGTTAARTVCVTSATDPVGPIDYSGSYARDINGIICTISKVGNGVYSVTNPGGAGGFDDVLIYMLETEVGVFVAPQQPSTAGPFGMDNITLSLTGGSWTVQNAGFGTGLRIFLKEGG